MKRIFLSAAFVIFAASALWCAPSPAEKIIFDALNHQRESAGIATLEWNDNVAKAARLHAEQLADNHKLSHQFPGESPLAERLGLAGARFTDAGENVALTEYVEDVHPALMTSDGHRANMMNPRFNSVGIGVVEREGKVYATEDFVLAVPEYSEAQFAGALAEAFNRERKSRGSRIIEAHLNQTLHQAACSTDGVVSRLNGLLPGTRAVVVFTSSEPHTVPEELMARAAGTYYRSMNFGVCFRPDQKYGYGNFWVVVAFVD
ncbi:MAG TPA: CAP domain-containing protein [Candidatus Angelobacter sp.]|nr:CAP domain-containing protein [Candidatus Angelobacter sp.]